MTDSSDEVTIVTESIDEVTKVTDKFYLKEDCFQSIIVFI